jgi:MYXO-CTERM domain-containing protein
MLARMIRLSLFLLLATTGTGEPTTGASTGATDGVTDTDGDPTLGPMPPVYEPCGCASAGEGGGWALLALALTSGSRCRRRRPTSRRSCCR